MVAENEGDNPKVAAIKVTSPSRLTTDRGITIGDWYNKVVRVYGQCRDQENSVLFKRLTAGSIYGGLNILFPEWSRCGNLPGSGSRIDLKRLEPSGSEGPDLTGSV